LLLGAVAAALAESARRRRRGLRRAAVLASRDRPAAQAWATFPGPSAAVLIVVFVAFVLLALGPILWSAFSGIWHVLRTIDVESGLDPPERMASFKAARLAATRTFEHGHLASSVGAVCAGLGSAFLLWHISPARARAKLLGRPTVARPSRQGPRPRSFSSAPARCSPWRNR
jgi:ABC-type Fe3+ transport system permease subunit